MPGDFGCESCGGKLQSAGGGRLQCASCGAKFTYGTRWLPYLLTWAIVGAIAALATYFGFAALGLTWGLAGWVVFGLITGVVASLFSRRFRTLRKV